MAKWQNSKSLHDLSGLKDLVDARVAIIKTEWNERLVKLQMEGAQKIAVQMGVQVVSIETVPGCVELPFGIRRVFETLKNTQNKPEAIIAFGDVVRGDTPHFEYVCQSVTDGVLQLNLTLPIPVIFGVLTVENLQQALDRLGGAQGHKGEEAMITALKMIQFNRRQIRS